MMDKKISKILGFILLLSSFVINTSYCKALGIGTTEVDLDGDGPVQKQEFSEWASYNKDEKKYRYRYKSIWAFNSDINLNAYDLEGKSLIPYSSYIDPNEKNLKAGTWIGINATEIKSVSWGLGELQVEEIKKKYKCTYTIPGTTYCAKRTSIWTTKTTCDGLKGSFSYAGGYGICSYCSSYKTTEASQDSYEIDGEYAYNETPPKCNSTSHKLESPEEIMVEVTDKKVIEIIENKIINHLHGLAVSSVRSPSGILKYKADTNDINTTGKTSLNGVSVYYSDNYSPGKKNGTVRQDFDYSPKNICINVKTSDISYKSSECGTNEMKIENGTIYENSMRKDVSYWRYFIPLNANSKSEFTIDVVKNGDVVFNAKQCASFMETFKTDLNKEKDDYRNYIIPADNTKEFVGDYNQKGTKSTDWKILTGNTPGCQIAVTIKFPIAQKFYNEQEDSTFKGFNFYYKPINVNNPFPNGIPTNSIWTKKEIDKLTGTNLNKDNITYIANVTNAKAIRDYKNQETNHKKNLYTSWENMHLNGVSDFIENGGFVKRNVSKTDFYKLGCGPANEKRTNSDGTTNYLYQQECGA